MSKLKTFDAIIGHDTLCELSAIIDTKNAKLIINQIHEIPLLQHKLQEVNKIVIRDNHLLPFQKEKLHTLLQDYKEIFQPPDSKLSFTTRIKAEIRTIDDNPIYSKSYPYPQSLKTEVNKQISKLLDDGIIRPSKSPYNSPIWIVPKKLDASKEKKYRLVIDFRKLNLKTISDRYPIPDTSTVLANLGQNKYFSTIDLTSGFHQVPMSEKDIEKTAFSINNGKYEFVRMPFGLKNAPSIFQRVMDDVLKDHIGKICYVYIDDIIIFGKTFEEHMENLKIVLETLKNANFRIQPDKSEFFKTEVEFLGFIVSENGLMPNPKKVEAIRNYPQPTNLKELRMFLGLSGYYRRFIKDYAKLARPLTVLLRGVNGHRQVSKNESKNYPIKLNENAINAFDTLKGILSSSDILVFPDFNKPFIITTDASNVALGAVLSQKTSEGDKPISFISRSLTKSEENYATNEKEMLAIVWALNTFRNFIYGTKIHIYTDHMPLTYAVSPKNINAKLKRWKSYIEEHDHEIFYKKGTSNTVADALSRIKIQNINKSYPQLNSLTPTLHSSDNDDNSYIPSTESPINVFKNQLIFKIDSRSSYNFQNIFGTNKRHIFSEPYFSKEFLEQKLKEYLAPNVLNGILTSEPIMSVIQEIYKDTYDPNRIKVRFSQKIVNDITDENEQIRKIKEIHTFAHRNIKENIGQLIQICYFPKMHKKTKQFIDTCEICKLEKYDRKPQKDLPVKTPVPQYPGEIIHIDIFAYTQNNIFLTSIDKLSKFVKIKPLKSRSILDVQQPLMDLLYDWDIPAMIIMDNERTFTSEIIEQQIRNLGIQIFKSPVNHSETNGQIERVHSTIREIIRCTRNPDPDISINDIVQMAVHKYNNTIHSFTKNTPRNIYTGNNIDNLNFADFARQRQQNLDKVVRIFQNKNNKIDDPAYVDFPIDSYVYEKTNTVSKREPRFKKIKVKENHTTFIIDENGRKVHKANLRKKIQNNLS